MMEPLLELLRIHNKSYNESIYESNTSNYTIYNITQYNTTKEYFMYLVVVGPTASIVSGCRSEMSSTLSSSGVTTTLLHGSTSLFTPSAIKYDDHIRIKISMDAAYYLYVYNFRANNDTWLLTSAES